MQNIIEEVTKDQLRTDHPEFRPGDTVKVHVKVVEGSRERIQVFEGVVIKRQGGGISETFTVRKISYGVGVERTFPVHSPRIAKSKFPAVALSAVRNFIIFVTCAEKQHALKSVAKSANRMTDERGLFVCIQAPFCFLKNTIHIIKA